MEADRDAGVCLIRRRRLSAVCMKSQCDLVQAPIETESPTSVCREPTLASPVVVTVVKRRLSMASISPIREPQPERCDRQVPEATVEGLELPMWKRMSVPEIAKVNM